MEKMYGNLETGTVGNKASWEYINEDGNTVNAVDLEEVVEVIWNSETESWDKA
jgi:hypothetical protein